MARHSEKENFNRVLKRDDPSHVPAEGVSRGGAYRGAWPTDCRPAGRPGKWRDEWGVGWTDVDGEVFPTDPAVDSYEKVDQVPQPDPNAAGRFDEIRQTAAEVDRDRCFFVVGHPYFLYEKAINVLGPEEFGVAMLLAPDKAHALLDGFMAFELGVAARYAQLRPDHLNLSDDFGHQDRLAMAPDCSREFFKPRLKTMVDFYRRAVGPDITISLHSCGHVMPILEDLMEIGLDILHPVQSRANDLPAMRRITSGRLTLAGGIDGQSILPHGSVDDVRREVRAKLDLLWENGGYLPMPEKSHGVPKENLAAVTETIRTWSRDNVEK